MQRTRLAATAAMGLAVVATACDGSDEIHEITELPAQHAPRAANVQVWPGSEELKSNKLAVVNTLRGAGASSEETCLVLAMLMQETNNGSAVERDTSKDGAGDARNFSAFNMNKYALRLIGVPEDRFEGLNDDKNLPEATTIVLQGLRKLGEKGFMDLHRGGQSGYEDGVSYGCQEFNAQMRAVQATLLAQPHLWESADRVAGYLEHV